MSGPPPGYDPGQSVLQGGTATIHPVMGGGGGAGLPAGFEHQSLLQGGEAAPIHAVSGGGGGHGGGHGGGGSSRPTPIRILYEDLSGIVTLSDSFKKELELAYNKYDDLARKYTITQRNGLWKRRKCSDKGCDISIPKHVTVGSCNTTGTLDDTAGEVGFDRLAILLPFATSEILVFSPVRGNRANFEKCVEYIMRKKVLESLDKVVLFAPPFFALNVDTAGKDIDYNRQLFCRFLELKELHPNMHILTQRTITNRVIGECMSDKDDNYPIATLLEATYVLYPYKRVFSEKGVEPDVEVGGIIFSAAAANEVSIPESTDEGKGVSPTKYVKDTKGELSASVAFPPKTDESGVKIYDTVDPKTYRYYGGGATVLEENKVQRFLLRAPVDRGLDFIADDASTDIFIESQTELHVKDVPIVRVPLGARTYFFRSPGEAVMGNWKNGRFTSSEADFLNDLNLRKSMLAKIFEGEPNPYEILANFLKNAVNGRCFTDERMLTWSECQASREFVSRVFQYFMLNDARIATLDEEEREVVQSQLDSLSGLQQVLHHSLEQQQGVVTEVAATALGMGADLRVSKEDAKKSPAPHVRIVGALGSPPPAPSGPAPSGPTPSGPAPSGPAPSGPAPSGPTPSGPAPSGPDPSGPAPSGPAPAAAAASPAAASPAAAAPPPGTGRGSTAAPSNGAASPAAPSYGAASPRPDAIGGGAPRESITQLITPMGMTERQQGGGDAAYQHGGFQFGSKRVLYDMYEENKYMIEVIVFEKKTQKYWKGMVSFKTGPDELPNTRAEQIVAALNEEYPGYSIIF